MAPFNRKNKWPMFKPTPPQSALASRFYGRVEMQPEVRDTVDFSLFGPAYCRSKSRKAMRHMDAMESLNHDEYESGSSSFPPSQSRQPKYILRLNEQHRQQWADRTSASVQKRAQKIYRNRGNKAGHGRKPQMYSTLFFRNCEAQSSTSNKDERMDRGTKDPKTSSDESSEKELDMSSDDPCPSKVVAEPCPCRCCTCRLTDDAGSLQSLGVKNFHEQLKSKYPQCRKLCSISKTQRIYKKFELGSNKKLQKLLVGLDIEYMRPLLRSFDLQK